MTTEELTSAPTPANAQVMATQVDVFWLQIFCSDCKVEMQFTVTDLTSQPPMHTYLCPTCGKFATSNQRFPHPHYQNKPIVQPAHNFINPNKGPRGRH